MSTFRLERLLNLRKDQESEAKIYWAQAEAAVRDAIRVREEKEAAVLRAFDEITAQRNHASIVATLSAYERLDALQAESHATKEAVDEARRRAADARTPYEQRRLEVEALRRLQERWLKDQRKERRRKENREREAFIQGRAPLGSRGLFAPSPSPSQREKTP